MKLSSEGQHFIKVREAPGGKPLLAVYLDQADIPTVGWGHTGPDVKMGDTWTLKQCEAALAKDVAWTVDAVNENVKVPVTQSQFDALVSLCFNIGETAFARSTLLRLLNARDYRGAAAQFMVWNKITVNGQLVPNQGLINRRKLERALFESGGITMAETENTTADTVQTVATVVGAATGHMWVGPALAALRGLWPELGKLFKPGTSEVAQRNVKAAEAVVNAVIEATGAKNAQEAVEVVQADSNAAATARTAAIGTLDQFGMIDATGVADARKFASEIGGPIWHMGAFWLSAAFIPLIYYVTYVVVDNESRFGSDTRAFVVGAVLGTLLGSLCAFWLGTNASSQKKTDILASQR